ncbi:hypothetical protein [Aphanothece hegewaldii]|nr:hypothetical protein [Aphanothece hegewaldii]
MEVRRIEKAEEVREEKANQGAGIEESELDEMWSFVGSKKNQIWL